jgi:hypothetical protein
MIDELVTIKVAVRVGSRTEIIRLGDSSRGHK